MERNIQSDLSLLKGCWLFYYGWVYILFAHKNEAMLCPLLP